MPSDTSNTAASSHLLTEIVEWLPIAALVISGDGVVFAANSESERLLDYDNGELLGQSIDVLVPGALAPRDGRELFARRKDGAEVPVEISLTPMLLGDGAFMLATLTNTTGRRDLLAQAEDRLEFERLVGELGAEFINLRPDDVDHVIEDALGRLVRALGLDRCALFQVETNGELVPSHQWTRPGWAPTPQRISAREQFPWHLSRIRAGELVSFTTLDDIPDDIDRDTLRQLGIKSGVTVPLVVDGQPRGALGFAAMREPRSWTPAIINRLRVIGLIFAHALARKAADERLRAAHAETAATRDRLHDENQYLRQELKAVRGTRTIVGHSAPMRRVLEQVRQAAIADSPVLLVGEAGTGKSLLASHIHELSARSERAMIRVNCSSVSPSWTSFPGFASGSTLFLADVADLPAEAQASLARALKRREALSDGGTRDGHLDVRLIAATKKDLKRCIDEGSFREDLYYLLSVFTIHVPPLRDRREDIPLLVWRFVDEFSEALGQPIDAVDQDSMAELQGYGWPGNARELRNIVERAMTVPVGRRRRLRLGIPGHETGAPRGNGGAHGDAQALHTSVRRGTRRTVRPVTR